MNRRVEFRLLGPVEVRLDDEPLDIGHPRQRGVLAALLVDVNRAVPVEAVIDRLWGDDPPSAARNVVSGYVTRLRAALTAADDVQLLRRAGGYLVLAAPQLVDIHEFRDLAAQAQDLDDERAGPLLHRALALWRGAAMADLTGQWYADLRRSWQHEKLAAMLRRNDIRFRRGQHAQLLGELRVLVADHPLDEQMVAQLMLAAYRSNRQAEAIDYYQQTKRRLADDLGVDPGPALQQRYHQILHNDPALAEPAVHPVTIGTTPAGGARQSPAPPPAPRPAQLPPGVAPFAGRDHCIKTLDALISEDSDRRPSAVLITAIAGTAGVGKTALAVHWAHRVADQFPDGQLYVNLRGFDPSGSAMQPAEAIRGFLDALGIPAQRVPIGLEARTGLYRSLLAGRRILVLLDNARDVEQIRPLLPGAPGCLVVVTSRNRLAGLVAAEGAKPLTVDLLTVAESRQLLTCRIGPQRVASEPAAVDQIVDRCTGLPLALAVVAAHAETKPHFPLAELARQLQDTRGALDALAAGDVATDVRAVFSWSYHALSPTAARLFRLLGLHSGPDISAPAAASLAGVSIAEAHTQLAELTQAHLLTQPSPGRYICHDLLRAYAIEQANAHDSEGDRRTAVHRVLDYYLHTAHAAALAYTPHRDPIAPTSPQPAVTPDNITDRGQALAWLTTEHHVLLAAIAHAADNGFDTHTWQLASTLTDYLYRRGHWQDLLATHTNALHAAQRMSDPLGQAHAHRGLAGAFTQQRRYTHARTHVKHALRLCHELNDQTRVADTLLDLGYTYEQQGRYRHALRHAQQALDILNTTHHTAGQAKAHNNIGWYHAQLGDHQQALTHCQKALALSQHAGDRWVEAATWDSLGCAHHHLGHHQQATTCYRHALDLRRHLGDRYWEADTLTHLGEAHLAAGEPDAARTSWHQALDILAELHHPNADDLRSKLHDPVAYQGVVPR